MFLEGHSVSHSASISNQLHTVCFLLIRVSDGGPQEVLHVGPESLQTPSLMISLREHVSLTLNEYFVIFNCHSEILVPPF